LTFIQNNPCISAYQILITRPGERVMDINKDKCVGCGNCHIICTMGAISLDADGKSIVNQDECVECSTCYRVLRNEGYPPWFVGTLRKCLSFFRLGYLADEDLCPTGALTPPELSWPRNLRTQFSDPSVVHPGTGVPGRGTDEIKSNDVTGRLRQGEVGLVVEIGRPGIGAFFRDIEKIAMALAPLGPVFEPENPVTHLIADFNTGRMKKDILGEKVLSAIIELKTHLEKIPAFLAALEKVQHEIDTVISVGIASRCLADGSIPHEEWVRKAGYLLSPGGKTNLGLGRPFFREEEP
jgi:ferredoxin